MLAGYKRTLGLDARRSATSAFNSHSLHNAQPHPTLCPPTHPIPPNLNPTPTPPQAFSNHVTILWVHAQLVSNYQTVIMFYGGEPFPEPFATVVRWMEVVNLDAFAVFRVDCVASGWNYTSKLLTATLLSVAVVAAVFVRRLAKNLYGGRIWDGVEMKFMFLFIFFTLPTVSQRAGGRGERV